MTLPFRGAGVINLDPKGQFQTSEMLWSFLEEKVKIDTLTLKPGLERTSSLSLFLSLHLGLAWNKRVQMSPL